MHCTLAVNAYYGNLYVELGYVAVIGIFEFLESAVLYNKVAFMFEYSIAAEFTLAALIKPLISLEISS